MKQQETTVLLAVLILISSLALLANGVQEDQQAANSTTTTKRLFTYAGSLLPSDWSLVSVLNDRVVIGFNNGSARNSHLDDLEPRDKIFVQKLQNGTLTSTPLAAAKEKIAQWSSSVTSTVSKFGKSFRDQFDSLINNRDKSPGPINTTIIN